MELCTAAVREGIAFCLENLIPSLFPFFVLSSLLIQSGFADTLAQPLRPWMPRLFGISAGGGSAVLPGSIGGYGVGVASIRSLYEKGSISKGDAEHLLAFCTNTGPAFCLGLCARVLGGFTRGLLLYAVQLISAFAVGFFLRGRHEVYIKHNLRAERKNPLRLLPAAVQSAVRAVGNLCGFVVWFFLLLRLAQAALQALGIAPQGLLCSALLGFFEVTGGIFSLSATKEGFLLAAAMTAWGGICVHLQALALLDGSGLSAKYYWRGKLLQTVIAAGLAALLLPLL